MKLNIPDKSANNLVISGLFKFVFVAGNINPQAIYITKAIIVAGPVVHNIDATWSYKLTFDAIAAIFVVSDRGDILSPK
ncbi:hypothetical protein CDFC105_103929 [Clostridioides difficile]|nr:hypothetical protein CDFC105_103928 [Clostridioides difficile]CZT61058.1 hypothetical protein CDFC105_103929 [Clostridioides difficile]